MPWVKVEVLGPDSNSKLPKLMVEGEKGVQHTQKNEINDNITDKTVQLFMDYPLKEFAGFAFKPYQFEVLKGTTIVPLPRSGHRVVCDEGNLYSFGGYYLEMANNPLQVLPSQTLFQELWELNSVTNEWRHLLTFGEAPAELASHSMLLHGHFLLVYGGTGLPFGHSSSNKIHVCDLRTLTWRLAKTSGQCPTPQYGQAVVMDKNDAFYVVGGTTGFDYSIDIHKLDMKSFEWKALFIAKGVEHEPAVRYRHEIFLENDIIYVLGGGTFRYASGLKALPAFNLKTMEWAVAVTFSQNGEYPKPRLCHGCARLGDYVYITGGHNNTVIFDDIWRFHLPTLEWTRLSMNLPVPSYFHASAISPEGCLFIYGGVIDIKQSYRSDLVYKHKVWLTVPSLKEMCWNAVNHYARQTDPDCSSEMVSKVPPEYKDRLPRKIPAHGVWPDGCAIPPISPRFPVPS